MEWMGSCRKQLVLLEFATFLLVYVYFLLAVLISSLLMYLGFPLQCLSISLLNGKYVLTGEWTSANTNCNMGSLCAHYIGREQNSSCKHHSWRGVVGFSCLCPFNCWCWYVIASCCHSWISHQLQLEGPFHALFCFSSFFSGMFIFWNECKCLDHPIGEWNFGKKSEIWDPGYMYDVLLRLVHL